MKTTRQNHSPVCSRGVFRVFGSLLAFPGSEGLASGFEGLASGWRVVLASGFLLGFEPRRVVARGILL
jgi:hypothetical protein